MGDEHFASARQLLRWASEDIESLNTACERFLSDEPYSLVFEDDDETGYVFLKLVMASVPDEVCKLASHALWDIKHALDHAACAAVRAVRGDQIADIHFPIGSHLNHFKSMLKATANKGAELKYPLALHDTFRSFEPYPLAMATPAAVTSFAF